MATTDEITRALGWLNQSGIQTKDNALYQAIKALINNSTTINTTVVGQTASLEATYLTFTTQLAILPNSRQLTAGFGISLSTTTSGQLVVSINQTQAVSFAKIFMMGA